MCDTRASASLRLPLSPSRSTMRTVSFALLVVALTSVGCSSDNSPKLTPVKGKVVLDGQPLTRGSVSFRPQDGTGKLEPAGTIEADGTYTLYTNQKPGAPLGKYYALVVATEEIDPNNASATPKSLIPRKYADISTKQFQIEVIENAHDGHYDLRLTKH